MSLGWTLGKEMCSVEVQGKIKNFSMNYPVHIDPTDWLTESELQPTHNEEKSKTWTERGAEIKVV